MSTYIEDWSWKDFDEVGSTNDEAKKHFISSDIKKFVVTAKRQSSGRGRRGRNWVSIDGNLFASFVLDFEPKYIGVLSFIVSLSVFDVIKNLSSNIDIKLKWPNDVLVEGKKISGILVEKGEGDSFVVGVGVNIVGYPQDINPLYHATSLQELGIITDRIVILKNYISVFNKYLELWKKSGFAAIRDIWLKNAKNIGQRIIVKFEKEEKEGIFYGVDDNGYLLLEHKGNIERIYAGDVFF